MQKIPLETVLHTQQAELGDTEANVHSAYANGRSQGSNATRFQQGKRIIELLTIVLEGVEWREIDEGRADDTTRC